MSAVGNDEDAATAQPPPEKRDRDAGGASEELGYVRLARMAKQRRTPVRQLPRLIIAALRLVWAAGRRTFVLTVIVQLFTALAVVAQVFLVKVALDAVLDASDTGGSIKPAAAPVILLALLTAVASLAAVVMSLQQRILSTLVSREVSRQLLEVSGAVDLAVYEDPEFFDQAERVYMTASTRTLTLTQGVVALGNGGLGIVAGTTAVLLLAPVLLPLLLLSGIPLFLASRRAGRLEFEFAVAQSATGRERVYLQEVLTGRDEAKEVRAFALAAALRGRWERLYGEYIDGVRQLAGQRTRLAVLGNGAAAVLTAVALVVVLIMVERGQLELSTAGATLIAVRLLGTRVTQAVTGLGAMYESALFLQDLEDFLGRRQPSHGPDGGAVPHDFGEIHVDDVWFSYPRAEQCTLQGVSMRIQKGQVIALVGENGSGKTTLAKVLAGLYVPDRGAIRWDGADIRGFDPRDLRRKVAVIFQDFVRYKLTARDNIALGRSDAALAPADVHAAARQAGADAFLEALPAGYDTRLSTEFHGGADLSLGQWQRVALARAFVRDAPLVVLDEPSASLDARAEHELFERIRTLLSGRTVLLISHRFSTVRTADHIYVLEGGRVVEDGDHASLVAQGGLYAELFDLQARAYAPAAGHLTEP